MQCPCPNFCTLASDECPAVDFRMENWIPSVINSCNMHIPFVLVLVTMSYQKSSYEGIGGSASQEPTEGATAPLSSTLRPATTSDTKVQLKLYCITLITLVFNFTALMVGLLLGLGRCCSLQPSYTIPLQAGFYTYDVTIADSAIVQPPWLVNMHSWGSFSPIYWVHCSFDPGARLPATCTVQATTFM
jgi:hypothetical protein